MNHEDLQQMVEKGMVTGINFDLISKPDFCEACMKAKVTRKPFPKESKTEYKTYGDKIVADVWGPSQVSSLGENNTICFSKTSSATRNVYIS